MDAAFGFEQAVGEGPVELDRGAFDAGAFAVLEIELGDGPALFFAVHAVHAKQHFSPVLAFSAACAGVDLHDAGEFVLGLVESAFELDLFDLGESLVIGFAGFFFAGFAGLPEIEEYGKVFDGAVDGVVEPDPVFVELDVLENFGRPLVIVPETGAQRELFFFVDFELTVVDVKETSSGRQHGPS